MIDLLAMVSNGTTGYVIGGGGLGLGGIGAWLLHRQIKKVVVHVDDTKLHVTPDNGYVRQSLCQERSENFRTDLAEIKLDIKEVRRLLEPK